MTPVNISIPSLGNPANDLVPGGLGVPGNLAWTSGNGVGQNDIGIINLRDPLIPGTPAQNLEMVAPFSPFENGYTIAAPAAFPGAGVDGQMFNLVGYGLTGTGVSGIIPASGVQQLTLVGAPPANGTFTLGFTRPAGATPPGARHTAPSRSGALQHGTNKPHADAVRGRRGRSRRCVIPGRTSGEHLYASDLSRDGRERGRGDHDRRFTDTGLLRHEHSFRSQHADSHRRGRSWRGVRISPAISPSPSAAF